MCATVSRLVAERQHNFAHQCAATVVRMLLDRQARAVGSLCRVIKQLADDNFVVVVGVSYEQDAAKMSLKASQQNSQLSKRLDQRMKQLAEMHLSVKAMRCSHFQNTVTESLLSVSGSIIVGAGLPTDEATFRYFHWSLPPLVLPDGTTAALAAALRRMPVRVDVKDDWQSLAQYSSAVLGMSCMDRAAPNIAFAARVRQTVTDLENPVVMNDEEWCELHNCNNLKVGNPDLCKMASKHYSLSSLMKAGSYATGAMRRLHDYVKDKLVRLPGTKPAESTVAANTSIINALYDLAAPHHTRVSKTGEVLYSQLYRDLQELLTTDTGCWRSTRIVCHCYDPVTGKYLHPHVEACRDAFVMCYYKFYLGSAWPLPSVTKFTNLSIVSKKVQLAYAHHNLLVLLVEPYEYAGAPAPSLLCNGSGLSDYQIVYRCRKHDVYNWAVASETRWHSAITSTLCEVLDRVTYCAFGIGGKVPSVHTMLTTVADVQQRFLDLLDGWADGDCKLWVVLDAVTGQPRSESPPAIRNFMRRGLLRYSSSALRRYEHPLAHNELPIHAVFCDECSPSPQAKQKAWDKLNSGSPCCRSFFARCFRQRFGAPEAQDSLAAKMTLRMRAALRKVTTKTSESNHAHGQKALGKSSKPMSLAAFARTVYLARIRTAHVSGGGDPKWYQLADKEIARQSAALPRENDLLSLEDTPLLGEGIGAEQVAVAVQLGRVANSHALEQPKKSAHLNPVLVAYNARQASAKLLGTPVDAKFKRDTLTELKGAYRNDPDARQRMRDDYAEYLREAQAVKLNEGGDVGAKPLASTFWGWGTKVLPVPVAAVQAEVRDRGLEKSSAVWGDAAAEGFRVREDEVSNVHHVAANVTGAACGATYFNECRSENLTGWANVNTSMA